MWVRSLPEEAEDESGVYIGWERYAVTYEITMRWPGAPIGVERKVKKAHRLP